MVLDVSRPSICTHPKSLVRLSDCVIQYLLPYRLVEAAVPCIYASVKNNDYPLIKLYPCLHTLFRSSGNASGTDRCRRHVRGCELLRPDIVAGIENEFESEVQQNPRFRECGAI